VTAPREAFARFGFCPDALRWLDDLWNAIQVLDDVADGDPINRADLDRAIFALLVDMPDNQFFVKNRLTLLPALAAMVLKWKAADDAERGGRADARSFTWRAGFYDVVLMVNLLHFGPTSAMLGAEEVLAMYGEKFTDYQGEFPCRTLAQG